MTVSLLLRALAVSLKWVAFENRSTTVKTTMLPWEGGRPVTKSSEIRDQGLEGTNSGWRSPAEGRLEVLEIAQTKQAKTKSPMSRAIDGHQNRYLMRNVEWVTPGWQANLEEWPHRMTSDRKLLGTNKRPSGMITPSEAVRTFDSISQDNTEMTTFCGKMKEWWWKKPPNPPANDATPPMRAWLPTAPYYQYFYFVWREINGEKKTRKDAPCNPRKSTGTRLHQLSPLKRQPPPQTYVTDQGQREWRLKQSSLLVWWTQHQLH